MTDYIINALKFILGIIISLVNVLLQHIPATPSIPQDLYNAISSIFGLIGTIGYFVPLGTLSAVLIIIFTMYNIKIVADFISWILRKIPTING